MHEWALAEGVISTALKVAEKEGLKEITEIKIKIGELQQTDMEIFEFALKEIIQPQKALLQKTKIELELEPAVLRCRVCGKQWAFRDALNKLKKEESESIHFVPETAHIYIRCPECNSPDFEASKGRGIWVESISGER
ncbi:MAG: hydrogenase nickel incorporation protein HypA [candidate division KSB1 bacterium]|nr:hydrogenase nickel incorporation protein HypA [candidate division KSB1 bacterium]